MQRRLPPRLAGKLVRVLVVALCAAAYALLGFASSEDGMVVDGPWGRMELVPIRVRLPDTMVPDRPLAVQPWAFHAGRAETREMLLVAGTEPELADELMGTYDEAQGGILRPAPSMIRALSPDTRGRLYAALRAIPGNHAQQTPHKFSRDRLQKRFRYLKQETLDLLMHFLYERPSAPGSRLFSDLPALTRLVEDAAERVRLVQAVSEQESILLRLRIDGSTDPASLAAYWGRGGRRRDIEILIASLKDFDGGYDLDALYLLPPLARSFLFTYPRPENAARRDCFWTALNFFLPSPDDTLDGPALRRMMGEQYRPVDGPAQLGDILVLWRPTGEAEHAAVFIAGDVYFTKNGSTLAVPWLLVRLPDILERYDAARRAPLVHFRRVDLLD